MIRDELDTLLVEALAVDAERAPALPADWDRILVATRGGRRARRPTRHAASTVAWLTAAAATIGVLAVVARNDASPAGQQAEPIEPWAPNGSEFPIVDLGPASSSQMGVAIADLTRAIGVEGHPSLVVTQSIRFAADAAEVMRCVSENGSAGCTSSDRPSEVPSTQITSSVDNRESDYDLWVWDGIPAGAEYVTYVDGDQLLWQHPVAGVAAFPNVPGADEVAVAYDSSGVEVARVDPATMAAGYRASDEPLMTADLSQSQFEAINADIDTSIRQCLEDRGATITDDVAVFAAGTDAVAAWDDCVTVVKQMVSATLSEIGPRYYDQRTERPQSPDPFIRFSDAD